MDKAIDKIKDLTGKEKVILTRRGNKAIKFVLKVFRDLGMNKLLIQDQGGWITYKQYANDLKFELIKIKTDYGILDTDDLGRSIDDKSVLLINSMPGYHAEEDMEKIESISERANSILINDASGSIGAENAKIGDVIIGSFGRWKPVDAGHGGFIATDLDFFDDMESVFSGNFQEELMKKLEGLPERLENLKSIAKKVKEDLKDFEIIHKEHDGLNVIVKFNNDAEKEKIINYCIKNNLEYTLCPRYIRVEENAVSIEVKRK